ncbi:hypothetical protein DV096_02490 [Bradymonadaceae bacterium TMQ3]|nr:hypothetical protein DV096_02490 [Bradymonadaceae bacterium TMQ3]
MPQTQRADLLGERHHALAQVGVEQRLDLLGGRHTDHGGKARVKGRITGTHRHQTTSRKHSPVSAFTTDLHRLA